jgi:hypothetical protein
MTAQPDTTPKSAYFRIGHQSPGTPGISKSARRRLLRPPRRSRTEAAVHVPERIMRQRADVIPDEQSGLRHAIAHALFSRGSDVVAAKCRSLRSGRYGTFDFSRSTDGY